MFRQTLELMGVGEVQIRRTNIRQHFHKMLWRLAACRKHDEQTSVPAVNAIAIALTDSNMEIGYLCGNLKPKFIERLCLNEDYQ
jgi:hypothetical protein